MKKDTAIQKMEGCQGLLLPIRDTLEIISGKWKITIIGALSFGPRRFSELQREIEGIGTKMLSKELQDLEINELIIRTVYDSKPVTIEYSITEYGKTLLPLIKEMSAWGSSHRRRIMRKER